MERDVEETLADVPAMTARLLTAIGTVVQGKDDVVDTSIAVFLAGGHLLLEDVPGVGKTTLAKGLAHSIAADMSRIQFTSDMLPTDITGVSVYDRETQEFRFHPGPVFTNVLLGDEVNRATPKTQSALLEAMGERAVTVDGVTRPLPELFAVVATQNPHDMEGTFALPEAQRDRFMTRISMGYPDHASEVAMMISHDLADQGAAVATVDEVVAAQRFVARVHVAQDVARYIVDLVAGTREHAALQLGASPRAGLHLAAMARARAATRGRAFVTPDDVASLADTVLAHRLVPRGHAGSLTGAYETASTAVAEVVAQTRVR